MGEGGGQAYEASGGAGEEDLGALVGELVGEGLGDLSDRDAAGVGEVAADRWKTGSARRAWRFGEHRAREGRRPDGSERVRGSCSNGKPRPPSRGGRGPSAWASPCGRAAAELRR